MPQTKVKAVRAAAKRPARDAAPPPPAEVDEAREDATSSPDVVFQEVLNGLYDGRYVPGQKLIESDLTRRFKVSRGSVREALKRLGSEGVVKLSLHRGAYIRTLSRSEARDVLLLMEVMIGLAARLAANNIGRPGAADRIRQSYERLTSVDVARNFVEFSRARQSFYDTVVDVGGNRELAKLLPSMHLLRIQYRAYRSTNDTIRVEHYRQITEAILAGDAPLAEQFGRRLLQVFQSSIEQAPDDAFPPAS
jgi:DNA-binding GntR family transcriptional regulator